MYNSINAESELICKFCNSLKPTKNSLRQHEIRCKSNPDKLIITSNFIKYNQKVRNGEIQGQNQYTKAERLCLPKPKLSKETLRKMSEKASQYVWSKQRKSQHSESMQNAVKKNPESYSSKNVSGRVKNINYEGIILNGNWELEFVLWMNRNNIVWQRNSNGFKYYWPESGKIHLYFPDFYLPELNLYVEIKGYQRDRDLCKWRAVDNLIVIKQKEIKEIRANTFTLAHN